VAICEHKRISQLSTVWAETYWVRQPDGSYEPEPAGPICISRVISEETESWKCDECGAAIAEPR
jgi:hypothetical protein